MPVVARAANIPTTGTAPAAAMKATGGTASRAATGTATSGGRVMAGALHAFLAAIAELPRFIRILAATKGIGRALLGLPEILLRRRRRRGMVYDQGRAIHVQRRTA
jgi:hypothetical protein